MPAPTLASLAMDAYIKNDFERDLVRRYCGRPGRLLRSPGGRTMFTATGLPGKYVDYLDADTRRSQQLFRLHELKNGDELDFPKDYVYFDNVYSFISRLPDTIVPGNPDLKWCNTLILKRSKAFKFGSHTFTASTLKRLANWS